jgi:hypothetical protein
VKVFVRDKQEPYLVPRSTLYETSESFEKAMQHAGNLGSRDPHTLTFPDDNAEAWDFLLYYMLKGLVPSSYHLKTDYVMRCVHSWILGDKYGINCFQDLIMLELLRHLDADWDNDLITTEVLKTILTTAPAESKLAILAIEEVVVQHHDKGFGTEADLDELAAIPGFTAALVQAYDRWHDSGSGFQCRLPSGDDPERQRWRRFMVGRGPWRHWVDRVGRTPR